jgi:hypothetical protein
MTIHNRRLLSEVAAIAQPGDEFELCMFAQLVPGARIFEGLSNLKFRECNLTNCAIPSDAVTNQCQESQIDFCAHLIDGLPTEDDVCRHVIDTVDLAIDGTVVSTQYVRQHTYLSDTCGRF